MCEKYLSVSKQPTQKGYTIGFNLKGEYLKKYGFSLGDMVKVEISRNKIVLTKGAGEDILRDMDKENPCLKDLLNTFNLEVVK